MKILIAAPEAIPFIKTGGLADVAGALCNEFRRMKKDVRMIMPLYGKIKSGATPPSDTGMKIKVPVGGRIIEGRIFSDQLSTFFIECDEFFGREELYGTPEGDYPDNAARFTFFSRGVLEACRALDFKPDVVHCNDWQTGLIPLYLKTIYRSERFFKHTVTLLTIHNLGYQGIFPANDMVLTNLGWELFTPEGIEFYGKMNFLKAGIIAADILATVSQTYAKEILGQENGFGLDGLLRTRADALYGVINGIDHREWDPSTDSLLPAKYSYSDLSGKAVCKRELLKSVFKNSRVKSAGAMPLVGVVGRLSAQKGLDLIIESMHELLSGGARFVVLGKGDEKYHESFMKIAGTFRDRVSVTIGFDETLAHRIYAGADFLLMPSRYEPCGLGQLIALRYGCVPVARRTGGLADTIRDFQPLSSEGTGFLFSDYTASAMQDAVKRAFCVYTDSGKMAKVIHSGMKADFSWRNSARRYIELYKSGRPLKKQQK